MRYNLCSSCIFFRPEIKDATQITRKHCAHESMVEVFGVKYGFPSGSDIYRCDLYRSQSSSVADVIYQLKDGRCVCVILPSVRPKTRLGTSSLSDNKNQRTLKLFN